MLITQTARQKLVKELDKIVSQIVRNRDERCVTCGRHLPLNKRQAGHFIPRVVEKTRWDLANVNCQCQKCNVELAGNLSEYRKYIKARYGENRLFYFDTIQNDYNNGRLKGLSMEELKELKQDLEEYLKLRS